MLLNVRELQRFIVDDFSAEIHFVFLLNVNKTNTGFIKVIILSLTQIQTHTTRPHRLTRKLHMNM